MSAFKPIVSLIIFFVLNCTLLTGFNRNAYRRIQNVKDKIQKDHEISEVLEVLGSPNAGSGGGGGAYTYNWTGCNPSFLQDLPLIGWPVLYILQPVECNHLSVNTYLNKITDYQYRLIQKKADSEISPK